MNRYDDPEIRDFCERILLAQQREREICFMATMPFAKPFYIPQPGNTKG